VDVNVDVDVNVLELNLASTIPESCPVLSCLVVSKGSRDAAAQSSQAKLGPECTSVLVEIVLVDARCGGCRGAAQRPAEEGGCGQEILAYIHYPANLTQATAAA
jgi:hypothetical protein